MKYILKYKNFTINTFGENLEEAEKFKQYLNTKNPDKIWDLKEI